MANTPNSFANLEDVMNLARSIVNDAYNAGAGEILKDSAPFTVPYINSSLAELQDRLENNAVVQLTVDNYIVSGLDPVVALDPSLQTSLDVNGYNGPWGTDAALVLPVDLIAPEKLWERQTGSNLPFKEMTQPMEGLRSRSQAPELGQWEWRGNSLWFIGATTQRDVRVRYKKREAQIVAGTDFTTIFIDLPGAGNTLAYMIAYRYVMSRNPDTAPLVRAEVDRHVHEMIKRAVRQKQGIEFHRQPYGQGSEGGKRWNWL